MKTYKRSTVIKILSLFIVLIVLLSAVGCSPSGKNKKQTLGSEDIKETVSDSMEDEIDAETYYEEHAEIIEIAHAEESDNVPTEREISSDLKKRGFSQHPITAPYTMDGDLFDEEEISNRSNEKHPIYETYYVTENKEVWAISVINGIVMANPISYNLQSEAETQVIIAETDTIMSYDSTEGKFYETVPNQSTLVVKKVDQIDAETLERLTYEEIKGL